MTSQAPTRPFTESPQFKVMRVLVGAANPAVRLLLGSRFAGPMAKSLMLLRFRGRKSGSWRTTPVGFAHEGNQVVVVTLPMYRWWRNVADGAPVQLRLDNQWFDASARLLRPDDPEYDGAVALQVRQRGPNMLGGFGIPVTDDGQVPSFARVDAGRIAHIVLIQLGRPIARAA